MSAVKLDEDAIDEILYLSRANEAGELSTYLSELASQTQQAKSDLVAAAVDPYSKNGPLHYSAANGHIDVIKLLLSGGTDKPTTSASGLINAANDAGNTALHWAALNGHLECVKLLVQSGADVTIINKAGHDAVFEAEINDKAQVVEWLLGAVEELEKGISGTNAMPADNGAGGEVAKDEAQKDDSESIVTRVDTDVEGITKELEGLKTGGGNAQDG